MKDHDPTRDPESFARLKSDGAYREACIRELIDNLIGGLKFTLERLGWGEDPRGMVARPFYLDDAVKAVREQADIWVPIIEKIGEIDGQTG